VTKLSPTQAEPDSVHPDSDSDFEPELEFELMLDDWVQHIGPVIFHMLTRNHVLRAAEYFGLDFEVD